MKKFIPFLFWRLADRKDPKTPTFSLCLFHSPSSGFSAIMLNLWILGEVFIGIKDVDLKIMSILSPKKARIDYDRIALHRSPEEGGIRILTSKFCFCIAFYLSFNLLKFNYGALLTFFGERINASLTRGDFLPNYIFIKNEYGDFFLMFNICLLSLRINNVRSLTRLNTLDLRELKTFFYTRKMLKENKMTLSK